MYVYGSASQIYRCSICGNGINRNALYTLYQENLQKYVDSIKPNVFIEELEVEINSVEGLLKLTVKTHETPRKKMDNLVQMKLSDDLDSQHFTSMYKSLVEQVSKLNKSIPELKGEIDFMKIQMNSDDYVLNGVQTLYTEWDQLEFLQRRAIAELLMKGLRLEKIQ